MQEVSTESHPEEKKPVKKAAPKAAKPSAPKPKTKITIDLKDNPEELQLVENLCTKVNEKPYGRDVSVLELVMAGLRKLEEADLEALRDSTYSKMDRVHLAHEKYNQGNKNPLDFEDFLLQKLKIQ